MDAKILNIVKFTVTDRVGLHATNWDLAAVFYEDGRMEIVSVMDAVKKANQAGVRISNITPEVLTKNLENYRKVFEFDFSNKKAKTKSTDFATSSSSKGVKKKKNTTKKSASTSSNIGKVKTTKTSSNKKRKTKKKKKGIFGKAIGTVVGFFGGIAMGAYGKIEQLADWLTIHVVRKFDKKAKEESFKEKATSTVQAAKDSTKTYVKQSIADRQNKKNSKKAKRRRGLGKRVAAAATAVALALGLGSCTNSDVAKNAQPEQVQLTQDELQDLTDEELLSMINSGELSLEQVKEMLASGEITNDLLDNLTYDQLLQVTHSEIQQSEMMKVGKYLDYFNDTFANKYLETNHPGIRAALTWEEVNAINLAYNDFSKEEIRAIFNGQELSSADFTNSYKEATLQLMGAFVLETRDTPVNLDSLLNTEEGRKFYQKYNELFLKCKETNGQEQLDAVQAFYQELYKDFPISSEVREVGISHSESRDDIESYKLAITPMVAAAEMMFQNLEVDYTLSNKGVTYFNDLGLCEFAQGEFERAEQITLLADDDKSIPTYKQFMDAKVKELTADNIYFVSDEKRDISQYDLFQKWVNGHFNLDENGHFVVGNSISDTVTTEVVGTYSTSNTTYRTESTTTETSDRNKAVAMAGEDAVRRAEAEVNAQFAAENAANKENGEAAAEKNQQQMQEEADKDAEEIRDEIAKDDQDLQDKIEDANDTINQGGTVNEGDLSHGVDFDDEHSNNQGDLNSSVGNITTDGSGAGGDMPDPNDSGAKFDQNQPDYSNQPEGTFTAGEVDGQTFIEYEEPTVESATNEEIADAIVEDMALNPTAEEEAFVYTK